MRGTVTTSRRRFGAALPILLLIATLLAPGGQLLGQDIPVYTEIPDLSATPVIPVDDDQLKLSLSDAIAIALERNLSLVVRRYSQEETRLGIQRAVGIYDLNFSSRVDTLSDSSPAASNLDGAEVQEFDQSNWNFRLDQLTPTGGTATFDWRNRRQETNSLFATLNPSYRIDVDVMVRQPLLKNLGKQATERTISISRNNYEISQETFELEVTSIIQQVEQAYWNLAEAQAQLGVAKESLDLAVQLHEQNRIRVEVGTLAPLELVQSEAGVASRELDIIRARALVGDRGDVLRQLLNLDRDRFWDTPIEPTTSAFVEPPEIDTEAAIATALVERPEVRRKRISIENQEIDADYYRNQKRPTLDLIAAYGLNGVGGDVTDRDFITGEVLGTQDGDYGDAIDQILNADFDGWSVALTLQVPIQNRTAKADSAIANLALDRGKVELRDLELGIVTEVRRIARALEASIEGVESAEVNQRLQEKNYEAEQKRYDNGMSTSFQVLQIQEDLTDARSQYVAAVAAYRRTLALHYQSIGRLIDHTGVEIVSQDDMAGSESSES